MQPGKKFVINFANPDGSKKTVNVADCQESITSAQVATFGSNFNEFTDVDYTLGDCYYEIVTHEDID